MPSNQTIIEFSIQLSAITTDGAIIEVYKNNDSTTIYSVNILNVSGFEINTLNIDLLKGDYITVYVNGGKISDPSVIITTAYTESL